MMHPPSIYSSLSVSRTSAPAPGRGHRPPELGRLTKVGPKPLTGSGPTPVRPRVRLRRSPELRTSPVATSQTLQKMWPRGGPRVRYRSCPKVDTGVPSTAGAAADPLSRAAVAPASRRGRGIQPCPSHRRQGHRQCCRRRRLRTSGQRQILVTSQPCRSGRSG